MKDVAVLRFRGKEKVSSFPFVEWKVVEVVCGTNMIRIRRQPQMP